MGEPLHPSEPSAVPSLPDGRALLAGVAGGGDEEEDDEEEDEDEEEDDEEEDDEEERVEEEQGAGPSKALNAIWR